MLASSSTTSTLVPPPPASADPGGLPADDLMASKVGDRDARCDLDTDPRSRGPLRPPSGLSRQRGRSSDSRRSWSARLGTTKDARKIGRKLFPVHRKATVWFSAASKV